MGLALALLLLVAEPPRVRAGDVHALLLRLAARLLTRLPLPAPPPADTDSAEVDSFLTEAAEADEAAAA